MKQKCKEKFDEAEESREKIEDVNLVSKKIQKLLFSCRLVGGGVVVACAYYIRGKYILTTLITNINFSTRAFSERERKECVNNGDANASFVSTNDATKINATKQQRSKIIVEKENI